MRAHTLRFAFGALLLAAAMVLSAEETRPVVTGIQAQASAANKITVSWILPEHTSGRRIVRQEVYRGTRPFTAEGQLSDEALIAVVGHTESSFTDTVSDYREYFYAVITLVAQGDFGSSGLFYDEELDETQGTDEMPGEAYRIVLPGVNATVRGSRVQLPSRASQISAPADEAPDEQETAGSKRRQPLAYLSLEKEEEHESTISDYAQNRARSLAGKAAARQPFSEPYVFEEDLVMPGQAGDDFDLFTILKTSFIRQDYRTAARALRQFVSEDRQESARSRARFYLGESYYFMRDYASAVTCFLGTEETMSPLVRKWSESALDLYEIPSAY